MGGREYNNWINSLRANYSNALRRRTEEEEEAERPPTGANKVERVHWYVKPNAKNHKTIKYDLVHEKENPKPVLRRGQPFYLAVRFTENFNLDKDRVVLNFCFGSKPSVAKGTLGVVLVQNEKFTKTKEEWDCRIDPGTRNKDLVLQVYIPAGAPVGIYRLEVLSGLQEDPQKPMNRFRDDCDCFILFNPWCRDDVVFLEDEEKREEYVMNDQGKVYVGAYRTARGRPWVFGQFDDVVLPVAMHVLERSNVRDTERGNAVKVVRGISAGVNCQDEDGILEGNWSSDFAGGRAPTFWTGSVPILEEYVNSGYQPVKYGQCWVYSALVTTVCRALGIPCRSVTNFVSAHDTNSSLTIDKFFDEGEEVKGGADGETHDSIWNFHVWNDVWMARKDLPPGYGGWQAIDATPQEESEGKMQCGPASLVALRRGDIGLNHDAPFVFAEVNADVIHWGKDPKSEWGWSRMRMNKYHVGKAVLTKKVGKDDDVGERDKDDVTNDYKSQEGTTEERLAIHNAIRGSERAKQYYNVKSDVTEDVEFDLVDIDKIIVGQPFQLKLVVRSKADKPRKVMAVVNARSVYYTGVAVSHIKKAEGSFVLQPKGTREVALTVQYNEYWGKLVDQCMIKIYAICRVEETGQTWTDEDDFTVEKPRLEIKMSGTEFRVRTACEATFSFTNPLDKPLTDCQLSVDGAGLMRPRTIPIRTEIAPQGKFTHTMRFLPRIHGQRKIIATFNSKELYDITGSKSITVLKRE